MQGEITYDGETYIWTVFHQLLTVTAPDGRQKCTQVGGSPAPTLARLLARELAGQKPNK